MTSQAFVPVLISRSDNKLLADILAVSFGVLLLSVLAQVAIPLPFSPIPITGQTFGVGLVSLLWGRNRGGLILSLYILVGSLGAPVFAAARSGWSWGPTAGYLIGMLAASFVIGTLADRGWGKSFIKSYAALFAGSVVTFSFGVLGLSYFLPADQLLVAGVLPFLLGDVIKTICAATLVSQLRKFKQAVKFL